MYYVPVVTCKLLVNVIRDPWECMTDADPVQMCDDLRKLFIGVGGNIYFDVITHPVIVHDGLIHRAYITVMSKEPELVLGVISRAVLRNMVLTLYFTDEFGDECALDSVSMRTVGTEGLTLDSQR